MSNKWIMSSVSQDVDEKEEEKGERELDALCRVGTLKERALNIIMSESGKRR
jgi:hypothetical protein